MFFNFTRRLKISHRLLGGFGVLVLLLAAVVGTTVWKTGAIKQSTARIVELRMPTAHASAEMINNINGSLAALRGYMLTGDIKFKKDRAIVWRNIVQIQARLDELSKGWTNSGNVKKWQNFKKILTEFELAQIKVEKVANSKAEQPAKMIMVTDADPLAQKILQSITLIINNELENARKNRSTFTERSEYLGYMADFRGSFSSGLANIRAYLLTGERKFADKFADLWEINRRQFSNLRNISNKLSPEQQVALKKLIEQRAGFAPLPPKMFAIRTSQIWNMANYLLVSEAIPRADKLLTILSGEKGTDGIRRGGMVENQLKLLKIEADRGNNATNELLLIEQMLLIAGVFFSAVVAYFTARAISVPIVSMTTAMKKLAVGQLNTVVPNPQRQDEIGDMAFAVQVFKDSALRNKELETDLENMVAERTRQLNEEVERGRSKTLALHKSESRLTELLELVPEAIISIDEEGLVCLFNISAETLFGYSKQEMIGSPLERLIPTRFRGTHQAKILSFGRSNVTTQTMSQRNEIVGLKKGGTEFSAHGSISKLHFDGNDLYTVLIQDISQQKNTARALKNHNDELRARDVILNTQNQRFDAALTNIPVGLSMYDSDRKLIVSNDKYAEVYGLSPHSIKPGISMQEMVDLRIQNGIFPGDNPEEYRQERILWTQGRGDNVKIHRLNDGRYIENRNHLMFDGGWLSTHDDVTERIIVETEMKEQNQRLDAAISAMSHGLAMFDGDEKIIVSNDRYATIYRLSADQIKPGMTFKEIIEQRVENGIFVGDSPEGYEDQMRKLKESKTGRPQTYVLNDGRHVEIRNHQMSNGGWLSIQEDVSDRFKAEKKIKYLADYDTLTDLPNRTQINETLENAIRQALETETKMALLYIDLDGFKEVNDTLGHPIGDRVLIEVGSRLSELLSETIVAGRISGDEFVMIVKEFNYQPFLERLADRICATLAAPIHVEHDVIVLSASIGISIGPPANGEADTLTQFSDLALYQAKADGGNCYRFFEEKMYVRAKERQRMAADLRTAIQKNELVLHYQPQVDLRSGKINGYEALVRWQHDELGMISPFQFIGLAEETGQISEIGEWVLRTACEYALEWPNKEKISVNLSPVQFKRQDVNTMVKRVLWETGLDPQRLELEITENVLIQSTDSVIIVLRSLAEMGVSIALDDFGTGFSSLSYLTTFPFNKIKIDKTFIDDLGKDTEVTAIVAMIVGLGRNLDTIITAEGIEEFRQHELLRASGCDQGQGYFYGRPQPLILEQNQLDLRKAG
jgi:diguanylate cyclase (GGDEF)-like protein/PAS domain S-box-containing protein